jgi:hypothetical protein
MNIEDFENGQPLSCDEPPMACKMYPDNCFCRTVEMRKREDGFLCAPVYSPEKRDNHYRPSLFCGDEFIEPEGSYIAITPVNGVHNYSERSEARQSYLKSLEE